MTAPQESNEHKTIIGAGTYHQVKAQLEHWNDRPPGTRLPGSCTSSGNVLIKHRAHPIVRTRTHMNTITTIKRPNFPGEMKHV